MGVVDVGIVDVGVADVVVVRSPRRRKTVEAREVGGVIQVSIPATMSAADERRHVDNLVARLRRRRASAEIDLVARSEELAARLDLPRPASIRWAGNQHHRWGSCSPDAGGVRISSRLVGFPTWVLDYVIVHELAHLAELGHTPRFWALVNRYQKAERARGYLMAKSMEPADEDESLP